MKIDGSIGKRLSVSFLSAFRTYCVRAWRINIDQVRSFECLQCMQRCNQNNIDCEHTLGILCEYIWAFRKACFKASSKSFWWCCSFLQQLWLAFSISFRWAFGNCVHKFSWKFIWIKEAKEKKRKEKKIHSIAMCISNFKLFHGSVCLHVCIYGWAEVNRTKLLRALISYHRKLPARTPPFAPVYFVWMCHDLWPKATFACAHRFWTIWSAFAIFHKFVWYQVSPQESRIDLKYPEL